MPQTPPKMLFKNADEMPEKHLKKQFLKCRKTPPKMPFKNAYENAHRTPEKRLRK
jgi:hypothetical protein